MTRLTDKEIGEIRKARASAQVISRPSIWQKTSAALLGGIVNPFLRQRDRARTVSELAALDDRMLSDIGIRRSQIELVADTEAATKHPGESLWARLFAAYKAGHNRRATINALSRLPDGLLPTSASRARRSPTLPRR